METNRKSADRILCSRSTRASNVRRVQCTAALMRAHGTGIPSSSRTPKLEERNRGMTQMPKSRTPRARRKWTPLPQSPGGSTSTRGRTVAFVEASRRTSLNNSSPTSSLSSILAASPSGREDVPRQSMVTLELRKTLPLLQSRSFR